MTINLMKIGLNGWLMHINKQINCGEHHFIATYNYNDWVVTGDKLQQIRFALYNQLDQSGYNVYSWSFSRGLEIFKPSDEKVHWLNSNFKLRVGAPKPDSEPLEIFRTEFPKLEKIHSDKSSQSAIIIRYGEHLLAESDSYEKKYLTEMVTDWPNNATIQASENIVIILAKDGSYDCSLSEHWNVLPVPLPNEEERYKLLTMIAGTSDNNDGYLNDVSRQSSGLRNKTIVNLFKNNKTGNALPLEAIKDAKKSEIRSLSDNMLEVVESSITFDEVAGLSYVKNELRRVLFQLKNQDSSAPRGMIFTGPPGVGKSFIGEAFANESDYVYVNLRSVRSKWVGDSEKNLDSVLNVLESLSPCIVAMDEMDQQLGRRGGGNADGGVSSRLFARLLEFLGSDSNRGRILFLGMSNFPTLLDPAVVDRFGKVIPFIYYQTDEYADLLTSICKKKNIEFSNDVNLSSCGELLMQKMISPRRVVDMIGDIKSREMDSDTEKRLITHKYLVEGINNVLNNHNPLQIERMTLEAIRMCTSIRQLPWYGKKNFRYFEWLKHHIDPSTGVPDFTSIDKRLRELSNVM